MEEQRFKQKYALYIQIWSTLERLHFPIPHAECKAVSTCSFCTLQRRCLSTKCKTYWSKHHQCRLLCFGPLCFGPPKIKTERQAREIYSSQQYAESLMQLWSNNNNGNLYMPYLSKYFNSPRRVKIMRNNFPLMFYSICNSRCVNAWILKCGETGLYCATLPHKCDRAAACI